MLIFGVFIYLGYLFVDIWGIYLFILTLGVFIDIGSNKYPRVLASTNWTKARYVVTYLYIFYVYIILYIYIYINMYKYKKNIYKYVMR